MSTSFQSGPTSDNNPLSHLMAPSAGVSRETSKEWIAINDDTKCGYLCCPPKRHEGDRFNALLILGGSEGGVWRKNVEEWAAKEYLALGVAYHQGKFPHADWGNVPKDLARIELAGFKCALDLLLQHPAASGRVGIIGGSRGGELALILGALYGNDANSERCAGLRAIVSMVPSACVIPAWSWNKETQKQFKKNDEPAWLLQGKAYVGKGGGADINSSNLRFRIPSEDISPPLFVVSGGKDKVWRASSKPEKFDARRIVKYGGRGNSDDVALHFPKAGHFSRLRSPSRLRRTNLCVRGEGQVLKQFATHRGGSMWSLRSSCKNTFREGL